MQQNRIMTNFNKSLLKDQRFILALVIVFITITVSIINPKFIETKNIIAIFQQISVLGIMTMAMSILLIAGGIDLSIGNIMILSGIVMSKIIMESNGQHVLLAIIAGVLTAVLCGFVNGVVVAKSKCMPLIITLGMSQVFFGISLIVSNGRFMNFKGTFDFIGRSRIFGIFPVMLIFLLVMILIAYFVLNYTKFGRRLVAIGGNEKTAYLSGVRVDVYKILVYTFSGLFCAVAAVVFCARLDSITATAGAGYELNALTAAVIGGVTFEGGRGTILGAFLGCLLMGVITNAMNILAVHSYTQTVISGLIIVAAVILSNINKSNK